jgi:hypothetical protein
MSDSIGDNKHIPLCRILLVVQFLSLFDFIATQSQNRVIYEGDDRHEVYTWQNNSDALKYIAFFCS